MRDSQCHVLLYLLWFCEVPDSRYSESNWGPCIWRKKIILVFFSLSRKLKWGSRVLAYFCISWYKQDLSGKEVMEINFPLLRPSSSGCLIAFGAPGFFLLFSGTFLLPALPCLMGGLDWNIPVPDLKTTTSSFLSNFALLWWVATTVSDRFNPCWYITRC